MDVILALTRAGGASRWTPLVAAGVPRRSLAGALARGQVLQPAPGVYALPGCSRAELARAAVGGVLSCLDAARGHGLTVLLPDPSTHVLAARGSRRSWPGTVVHRGGLPASGQSLGLVPALRSAARCSAPGAVALVDEVLRTGRCTRAELEGSSSGDDRAWRWVLAAADEGAMSSLESLARVELVRLMSPLGVGVEVQVRLRGVGRVDLLVDGWLVVEVDGFAFHSDRASYREDRRRDQQLSSHGYVWLRFSYEDVMAPGRLAARVLDTWSRGRPPGFTSLRG